MAATKQRKNFTRDIEKSKKVEKEIPVEVHVADVVAAMNELPMKKRHDLEFKNKLVPSREGELVITKLQEALGWLRQRQIERTTRGVVGTCKALPFGGALLFLVSRKIK